MPSNLVIACPEACSFHPEKIGPGAANALLAIRANGAGSVVFGRRASELLGHPVPSSNVQRHLKHYRDADDADAPPARDAPKPSDLEILDRIITKGFEHSGSWKPSIKDTMEAMKLKMQMTGNSAFGDFLALLDGAEEEEIAPENPAALGEEAELAAEEEEDLPEPLL